MSMTGRASAGFPHIRLVRRIIAGPLVAGRADRRIRPVHLYAGAEVTFVGHVACCAVILSPLGVVAESSGQSTWMRVPFLARGGTGLLALCASAGLSAGDHFTAGERQAKGIDMNNASDNQAATAGNGA